MAQIRPSALIALAAVIAAWTAPPVFAQQQSGPGWFVPGQQQPQRGQPQGQARPPARPATPAPQAPDPGSAEPVADGGATPIPPQQLQVLLPPLPEVPAIPKGTPPPVAVIGILSVPDILRISTAYQQADKELGQRRQKLNEDAQQEQIALRDLGQAFANQRAKLTPDQIRAKEREYQNRINESRRKFGDRERIIREAGQYVMAQIDRMLEIIAHQVATSRGVNVVLNRAQLLGTTPEFDLTAQVADVLNQILPTVVIPPDGVSPVAMAQQTPGGDTKATPPAAGATKPPQKN